MDAAIQSLTERGEYSTGWSKANKINLWARTENGEKAIQAFKQSDRRKFFRVAV